MVWTYLAYVAVSIAGQSGLAEVCIETGGSSWWQIFTLRKSWPTQ
jgi:hypothetical protein